MTNQPGAADRALLARLQDLLAQTPERVYVAAPLTRRELAALVALLERWMEGGEDGTR